MGAFSQQLSQLTQRRDIPQANPLGSLMGGINQGLRMSSNIQTVRNQRQISEQSAARHQADMETLRLAHEQQKSEAEQKKLFDNMIQGQMAGGATNVEALKQARSQMTDPKSIQDVTKAIDAIEKGEITPQEMFESINKIGPALDKSSNQADFDSRQKLYADLYPAGSFMNDAIMSETYSPEKKEDKTKSLKAAFQKFTFDDGESMVVDPNSAEGKAKLNAKMKTNDLSAVGSAEVEKAATQPKVSSVTKQQEDRGYRWVNEDERFDGADNKPRLGFAVAATANKIKSENPEMSELDALDQARDAVAKEYESKKEPEGDEWSWKDYVPDSVLDFFDQGGDSAVVELPAEEGSSVETPRFQSVEEVGEALDKKLITREEADKELDLLGIK